jgi:hypothetical protein
LRYIPFKKYGQDMPTAPYIDGHSRTVRVDEYTKTLIIDDDGNWLCDLTNGEAQENASCVCPDCNDRVDEDDLNSTYEGHGDSVCNNCIDNSYYYAYGRRGYQYYVHENDMTCVDDTYYHTEFLQDNNIVELHDGEYAALDDAICVHGDWYHCDDERIVRCEDTDEYEFIEDAWQCYVTDKWYIVDQPIRLCDIDTQDELTVHEDEIQTYEADFEYTPAEWVTYPVYQTNEGV